jgi:hypothetical protein
MQMRALSIRQPWAWLIVHGLKDVENRTWTTSFRGRFLVHAPQEFDPEGYQWVLQSQIGVKMPKPAGFERGGIVGEADLLHCVSRHDSPWFTGPHGFVLGNARPLPFRPLPGKRGFFEVEVEQDDQRAGELEQKVGVVVEFDAGRRGMLVKLIDWPKVDDRVRVREQRPTKDEEEHSIRNPQGLRLKFETIAEKLMLGTEPIDQGFRRQVVWVLPVPPVGNEDEPGKGDWVSRVWRKPGNGNGPPVDVPGDPIPRPAPPKDPPPPVEPPDPEPPEPEPPEPEPPEPETEPESPDDDEDDDEEPDLPDPSDFGEPDDDKKKGRRIGG